MAEHLAEIVEHSGVDKEIDSGAIAMLFDNVQISQYSHPVKSTVRELVSNGVDSVNEKKTARDILSGKAKVGDYYYVPGKNKDLDAAIKANPGVYKDSLFNPDYYDLGCLSAKDVVEIEYYQRKQTEKDMLVIRDNGIGLGDQRLYGYLKIGWSSKRLSKKPLGRFGIGAKSPLSMGVPYFEVVSVHNHRKFHFQIYSGHFESVVPAFSDAGVHDFILFYREDGTPILDKTSPGGAFPKKFYWEPTEEQNYTEIRTACKKHYLTDVENAVKSQLLYFDNVTFSITDVSGDVKHVPVLAKKLYEDDTFIISENNQFSKPHLVINNVNYGYVRTDELELEEMKGNIGIKINSGDVDVTPNRESIIWNDTASKVVLRAIKNGEKVAHKVIENAFNHSDFMEWLHACAGVLGMGDAQSVGGNGAVDLRALFELQHIAKLRRDVHPEFKPDPAIKYSGLIELMFPGIKVKFTKYVTIKRKKASVQEVHRSELISVSEMLRYPIYVVSGNVTPKRDKFMLDTMHPEGFVTVRMSRAAGKDLNLAKLDMLDYDEPEVEADDDDDEDTSTQTETQREFIDKLRGEADKWKMDPTKTVPLLMAGLKSKYEDVKVIETYGGEKVEEMNPEQLRKLQQRIVIQTPRYTDRKMSKAEPKIADLQSLTKELYWASSEHADLLLAVMDFGGKPTTKFNSGNYGVDVEKFLPFVQSMGMGLDGHIHWQDWQAGNWLHPEAPVLLVQVSKDNARYFADEHYHVTEFFNRFEGGTITMAQSLINWNTGRLLQEKLQGLQFMAGLQPFDAERYAEYVELLAFAQANFKAQSFGEMQKPVIEHLDRVHQLQDFVRHNPDDNEGLREVVDALFGEDPGKEQIQDGKAVETQWLDRADALLEWARPVKSMLNMIQELTMPSVYSLDQDKEESIREYILWRTA